MRTGRGDGVHVPGTEAQGEAGLPAPGPGVPGRRLCTTSSCRSSLPRRCCYHSPAELTKPLFNIMKYETFKNIP